MLLSPAFCLRGHSAPVTALRFLPTRGDHQPNSSRLLASGAQNGDVIVWNLQTKLPVIRFVADEGLGSVYEILSPPHLQSSAGCSSGALSHHIITQSGSGNLSVWDTATAAANGAALLPVSTTATKTQSYAKAFLMDLSSVPNCNSDGNSKNEVEGEKAVDIGGPSSSCESQSNIYCMAPIANNRSMGLFDLTRVKCSDCSVALGEIKRPGAKSSGASLLSASSTSPGWVAGGCSLPFINSWCCILAYQNFGVQAVFDIRAPAQPVAKSQWIGDSETVALGVTRNISWIGTTSGQIVASNIDGTGKIVATHQFDLHPECRDSAIESTSSDDLLELRKQELSLMKHRGKLGIGTIRFRPDSRLASVGCWDNSVRLFDVKCSQPLEILNYHNDSISAIDFDPLTGAFAVGSKDKRISCWSLHCSTFLETQKC